MLPRRGAIAIVTTALGLALLLSFKTTPAPGLTRGGGVAAVSPAASPSGGPSSPPSALGDAGSPPGQAAADQGSAGGFGGGPSTPRPTATPAPAAGSKSGTLTGQVVDTPYGAVQVQVTLSNGRIADVQAIQLPNDRMRSAMISQYVSPILRTESLNAQSASIDLVSGATYTSEGYAQSLQSALDQAHG